MNVHCEASSSSKLWDVTRPPPRLNPIQCRPHLDHVYTDPAQISVTTGRMHHLWMPFYSFVLSVPQCRSIQIVCTACYIWCYRITIHKWNLAVQYNMYLNVCCAININVYDIFYNTEEADLIIWYELFIGRNVASEIYLPVICMFFLFWFTSEKHLKCSLWTDSPCTFNGYIVYSVPEEQHNSVLLIDVNLSYLPFLASLICIFFFFFSKYFHRPEC